MRAPGESLCDMRNCHSYKQQTPPSHPWATKDMGKMLGGEEDKDPEAEKEKEEERQEALRQQEEERKAKYAKMEAERETMRQGIRDKGFIKGFIKHWCSLRGRGYTVCPAVQQLCQAKRAENAAFIRSRSAEGRERAVAPCHDRYGAGVCAENNAKGERYGIKKREEAEAEAQAAMEQASEGSLTRPKKAVPAGCGDEEEEEESIMDTVMKYLPGPLQDMFKK
ncbi:hypothetical protein JZ751_029778 [Albula glossodonta]|uniref:Complexin-1 n=1 Tax=Albula glossodonta TaxID=121402 RepID=A0A8T2NCV7_9TELE|nr:hypothetical protein JZ751_029778 [Albula glossodonta]